MAYRFRRGESAPEGIRRIAVEEAKSAIQNLSAKPGPKLAEAIHETRKSLKKLRALLRLIRPEIAGSFDFLNTALRDVGRKLSVYRDVDALVECFDRLRFQMKDANPGPIKAVRSALVARRRQLHADSDLARHKQELAGVLKTALVDLEKLPLATDGFAAIETGFRSCYRQGRRALARAQRKPNPERLHEWRKRAKDHWYHIRLLEGVWAEILPAYEAALKELEQALGEDHNLVLLREEAAKTPNAGKIVEAIDQSRKTLQDLAFDTGQKIYDQKPGEVTRQMRRLWEVWHANPKPEVKNPAVLNPARKQASRASR